MSLLCKNLIYGLLKVSIHLLLCLFRCAMSIDGMADKWPHMP
jgi:hypothetical protein